MMDRYPVAYAAQVQGPYSMFTPTWRELRKRLTKPLDAPKSEAPVFVPAELEGSSRAQEHVKQVTLLVFDIDNKDKSNQITADELCERSMRQKLETIIYSTPSHTREDLRYRVVIRLSEPIPIAEFKRVANAAIDLLQLNAFVDKSAVEPSRCFYLPACTNLNVQDFESLVTYGEPISPSDPRLQRKPLLNQPVNAQAIGNSNHVETAENIALVKAMLNVIPADIDYEFYRQIVWSAISLDWVCAKSLVTEWSRTSPDHWTPDNSSSSQRTLDTLIRSFDPTRGTSVGTLIHAARQHGYKGKVLGQASPDPMFAQLNSSKDPEEPPKQKSKYRLLNRTDLMAMPPQKWLVKNVLPSTGLGCVFGPSGGGKSFLLLSLAAAICEGVDWFGFRTVQTPVVYLCLEGSSGLQKRVKAWEMANGRAFPDNFYYLTEAFDLSLPTDVSALIGSAPNGAICIIDTLNRASPGSDENSSSDMGRLLAASKRIEEGIGGLVILCHHTGKDSSKGPRGHSSLHAAIDGEIEVIRNKSLDTRAWKSSKLKDEKDGFDRGFRLVQHELGIDIDGDAITSCTVEPTINVKAKPQPKGTQQKPAYDTIKSLLSCSEDYGQGGAPFDVKCVQVSKAQSQIAKGLATVASNRRKNRAETIIHNLSSKGFIHTGIDEISGEGWIWVDDE